MNHTNDNAIPDQRPETCHRCKGSDLIDHNEGIWCSNCGIFVKPPNPQYTKHLWQRATKTQPDGNPKGPHCSSCNQVVAIGDGIFDDGEWICWNCINEKL